MLRRLWKLEGTLAPFEYALAGGIGFTLKYALDWTIATVIFGHLWSPLSYWRLLRLDGARTPNVSITMFLVMLAVSLPFLWFAMAATLLRLRDAGWSAGWAALLFVPVLNLLLFIILSLVPARKGAGGRDLSGVMESALFAVVASVSLATAGIAFATRVVATYGIGLFVAVPFCVGYLAACIHRRRHPEAPVQPFVVAILSVLLLGGFLIAVAWEGLLCLLMSLPLALVMALLGAWLGIRSADASPGPRPAHGSFVAIALPLLMLGETLVREEAPVYRVDTAIVVNAPIERVWTNVVTFSDIPAAPEWYFRAGIAYPIRARIHGRGPGAIRYCEFTTGAFVEPIEVWDEPRLLRFAVTENPRPMKELSPHEGVRAPHLDGFMVSKRGQFALRALGPSRTEVTGTTWYQHHLYPAVYWTPWSDAIIHRIHLRVLEHVRNLSEGP